MTPTAEAALTAFYQKKLAACQYALDLLAAHGGRPKPLTGAARTEFIEAMGVLARSATYAPQLMASVMLLDWACPDWRKDDPELFGCIVPREAPQVRAWRQQVLDRDGHVCRSCGSNERLHAHHVLRWRDFPALRVELTNGVTLCQGCHIEYHQTGLPTWH